MTELILAIEAQAAEPWQAKVAALVEAVTRFQRAWEDPIGQQDGQASLNALFAIAADLTAATNAYTEQVRRDEREKVLSVERIAEALREVLGQRGPKEDPFRRHLAAALRAALLADSKEGTE
jgi:hypothetical protein